MGGSKGESSRRRKRWIAGCGAAIAAGLLFVAGPVVGEGLNSSPEPAPFVIAETHRATSLQAAGTRGLVGASASKSAAGGNQQSRKGLRRVTLTSRITNQEILTEEGKGTFVGIKCPEGARAISGGVLSKYINLLVSSSSPNHPLTRKYTPNTWWLTVTNVNVDGNGGTLPWQGVVNCLAPARIGAG